MLSGFASNLDFGENVDDEKIFKENEDKGAVSDPAGSFYRFTLPVSIVKKKKGRDAR